MQFPTADDFTYRKKKKKTEFNMRCAHEILYLKPIVNGLNERWKMCIGGVKKKKKKHFIYD